MLLLNSWEILERAGIEMTKRYFNDHDVIKNIIGELISITKDPDWPEDFREEIKFSLLEIKDDIDRTILLQETEEE